MAGLFDIEREFVDRLVIAIAAQNYGKKLNEAELKKWFEYSVKVAQVRASFWESYGEALIKSLDND
jgi:hypothetical protein